MPMRVSPEIRDLARFPEFPLRFPILSLNRGIAKKSAISCIARALRILILSESISFLSENPA
jgi:hypothetical protein